MVEFSHFRADVFYYTIRYYPEGQVFTVPLQNDSVMDRVVMEMYQFPVYIEDIGNGTLLHRDKAIVFMRWIRKAIQDKTLIKL